MFKKLATVSVLIMLTAFLNACSNPGFSVVNAPSHMSGDVREFRDLSYGDRDDQKLDLYLPPASVADRGQLVIFIYGGSWSRGERGNYYFVAETLTAQGYAVAIPDYIKYPEGVFPAFVNDTADSVAWLADNISAYADIDEFILMGHSAGAHIAALLVSDDHYLEDRNVDRSMIKAFVGLSGPYNYTPDTDKFRRIFGSLDDFAPTRPYVFASGEEPPMLLVHGDNDTVVVPRHSEKLADKVNAGGGDATVKLYSVGHISPVLSLSRLPFQNEQIRADVLEFLDDKVPVEKASAESGAVTAN
ncbi:MAG: alpha/beta hydrolase [Pseudomonadota bacterium]